MSTQLPPNAPRDRAGEVRLPHAQPITAMVNLGDVLMIYQADHSYRLRTPEVIDPERTDLEMPLEVVTAGPHGSSDKVIARVLLQTVANLQVAQCDGIDPAGIHLIVHALAEDIGRCTSIAKRVSAQVLEISNEIRDSGINRQNGGRVVMPRQVDELDGSATTFLITAKRAIKRLCTLTAIFTGISDRDNNFEHLVRRMRGEGVDNDALLHLIDERSPGVAYFIEHRNAQEHSGATNLEIVNFNAQANGRFGPPAWRRVGQTPSDWAGLELDMENIADLLFETAEEVIGRLLMHRATRHFPLRYLEVPKDQRDPANPIRWRMQIAI